MPESTLESNFLYRNRIRDSSRWNLAAARLRFDSQHACCRSKWSELWARPGGQLILNSWLHGIFQKNNFNINFYSKYETKRRKKWFSLSGQFEKWFRATFGIKVLDIRRAFRIRWIVKKLGHSRVCSHYTHSISLLSRSTLRPHSTWRLECKRMLLSMAMATRRTTASVFLNSTVEHALYLLRWIYVPIIYLATFYIYIRCFGSRISCTAP